MIESVAGEPARKLAAGATTPPLSVVMSVFNGEAHLGAAIESILNQSFANFEFIIVNDGSNDSSGAILASYAARDWRLRILDQNNTGLAQALRNGIALVRAPLIARMDADDLSLPVRFERQIAELHKRSELAAVTCPIEQFYDDGTVKMIARTATSEPTIPLYLAFFNPIGGHGQVMFRKSAYHQAKGYDPNYNLAEDYDLWSRLVDYGGFGVIDEVLYQYRVGHGSLTDKNKQRQVEMTTLVSRREYELLTDNPLDRRIAQALIDFWWARKPENTPIRDTVAASLAMDRAINSFFCKNNELATLEPEVRRSIAKGWRWRIPLANKTNLMRRALLASQAMYWAASARTAQARLM